MTNAKGYGLAHLHQLRNAIGEMHFKLPNNGSLSAPNVLADLCDQAERLIQHEAMDDNPTPPPPPTRESMVWAD